MIISHKEFPNFKRYEMDYCGRPFFMEVGKMAELCNASVLVGYGDTRVLVTATASARPKDGIDYFPLAVDFNEKLYAVGRIRRPANRARADAPERSAPVRRVVRGFGLQCVGQRVRRCAGRGRRADRLRVARR